MRAGPGLPSWRGQLHVARRASLTSCGSEHRACPKPSLQPPPHRTGGPHTFPYCLTCLQPVGFTFKNKKKSVNYFPKKIEEEELAKEQPEMWGGEPGPGLRADGGRGATDWRCQQHAGVEARGCQRPGDSVCVT